jgi:putative ABC transport system substrate-binding protein
MRRREFITLLGGAAVAWPLDALAQQHSDRMRRISVLLGGLEIDPEFQARIAAFNRGLQDFGWVAGRNLHVEYRFSSADLDLAEKFAAEIVGMAPDVIVANSPQKLRIKGCRPSPSWTFNPSPDSMRARDLAQQVCRRDEQ